MITRKHLQAIAEACADAERTTGGDAQAIGVHIIAALRATGDLTPAFDVDRFRQAIEDARPVPYSVSA